MRKNTTSWTKMTLCRAFSSLHQAALPEYLKSSGEERAKAKAVPRECDCRAGSKCQVDYAFSALILRPPQTTDVRQAEFNLSHSRPDVTSLSSGCDANLDQSPFIHLQQGAMHVVGVPPRFQFLLMHVPCAAGPSFRLQPTCSVNILSHIRWSSGIEGLTWCRREIRRKQSTSHGCSTACVVRLDGLGVSLVARCGRRSTLASLLD